MGLIGTANRIFFFSEFSGAYTRLYRNFAVKVSGQALYALSIWRKACLLFILMIQKGGRGEWGEKKKAAWEARSQCMCMVLACMTVDTMSLLRQS